MSKRDAFLWVLPFSIDAPIGLAIGIALDGVSEGVRAVLLGISAGTLVYVGAFEVLAYEVRREGDESESGLVGVEKKVRRGWTSVAPAIPPLEVAFQLGQAVTVVPQHACSSARTTTTLLRLSRPSRAAFTMTKSAPWKASAWATCRRRPPCGCATSSSSPTSSASWRWRSLLLSRTRMMTMTTLATTTDVFQEPVHHVVQESVIKKKEDALAHCLC